MLTGLRDVKRYHRTKLLCSLLGTLFFAAYAVGWIVWGATELAEFAANRWVVLLVFGGVFTAGYEVLTLPLSYYVDFILEHRYELSNQTRWRWFVQSAKGWCVAGLLGAGMLAGLYALLWYAGWAWWLWVWLGWIGVTVVLAKLFPVLILPIFYKARPLENEVLQRRLVDLAENASLRLNGVFELDLSTDTKAANAMLAGLGSTRRVYLSDTLLAAFAPQEIEVVFAHELGHHLHKHIWKLLCAAAVLTTLHVVVLVHFLHPLRGPGAELWPLATAAIPKIALAVTVVGLLTQPIYNALSRHFERQADREALRQTGNPEAYQSAMSRLAEMNLADPEPHPLIEWYFYDHPAMAKRIAMAQSVDRGPPR